MAIKPDKFDPFELDDIIWLFYCF